MMRATSTTIATRVGTLAVRAAPRSTVSMAAAATTAARLQTTTTQKRDMHPRDVVEHFSGRWALWRQDNYGNTECIKWFGTKRAAESKLEELQSKEHKQHYWVAADTALTAPPPSDRSFSWMSKIDSDPLAHH